MDVVTDAHGDCAEYVCHFKPMEPGAAGIAHREVVRWYEPHLGYASTPEEENAFGLTNALTLVTLTPSTTGTTLRWDQHYDAPDVAMMKGVFDEALADIAVNLVRRFGGRVVGRRAEP